MTREDLQAIVREAAGLGTRVAARGFGTYARPPAASMRMLDMRRLDRIVEYDPADLTVTVEAGCSFERLTQALAAHGQWLPIDVPNPDATTVGGMIAVGLVGPLRRSYGSIRDQLIGIEWVGGGGEVLRSGGRVVKNVAGYDLMKLHVGTRGRFGIITQATFRVRPRPAAVPRASADAATFLAVKPHDDPEVERLRNALRVALDPSGVFRRDT